PNSGPRWQRWWPGPQRPPGVALLPPADPDGQPGPAGPAPCFFPNPAVLGGTLSRLATDAGECLRRASRQPARPSRLPPAATVPPAAPLPNPGDAGPTAEGGLLRRLSGAASTGAAAPAIPAVEP